MVGDLSMTGLEESEEDQIMQTFAFLSPLFARNQDFQPNPRQPKARRKDGPKQPELAEGTVVAPPPAQAMKFLHLLTQMVLRHEHNWSLMQSTDSFVFFFNQEPTGVLKNLAEETQKWQQLRRQSPSTETSPLRQHLFHWLLTDLLNRLTQISKASKTDKLVQACIQKKLLLEDMSLPYLKWDHAQQQLTLDKKRPVQLPKMMEHIQDLLEDIRDPTLILRFHGMATKNKQGSIPWRLQLNLRSNRAYDLLQELAHSAVWLLQGSSLKVQTIHQSGLAKALQETIRPSKGQGKGKNHTK